MPRIALDLNKEADRQKVKGQWRLGPGLVPGEPNEGLVAQILNTPARLAEYDDSNWQVCDNIRQNIFTGFTFAWYRISVTLPAEIDGLGAKVDTARGHTGFAHQIEKLTAPAADVQYFFAARDRLGRKQARDRLPGCQRTAGRTARRYFHALCNPRV